MRLDAIASVKSGAPIVAESRSVRIDPSTGTPHPLTLYPASAPELTLVGLGVRTVSFLKMKVYSAGFYVDDVTLRKDSILPPADVGTVVERILNSPAALAIRIVPVRNTDFAHLRDGFTRTLLARQKEDRWRGKLSAQEDEEVSEAIAEFKKAFPPGSVPKGHELLLVRSPDGKLALEYDGKVLGGTRVEWVADNLIQSYFCTNPISPKLADDVAVGLQGPGNVRNVVLEHEKERAKRLV